MSMELFSSLEKQYGLPPGLLDAMWETESGRGKNMQSPAGAQGHFQFMPATAKQYGVNVSDLASSATGAAKYMKDLLGQFGGNINLALAAYNAGPGNVRKHNGIPPFDETKNYVQKISAKLQGANIASYNFGDDDAEYNFGEDAPAKKDKGTDWQAQLDEEAGTWLPIVGSVLGGFGGGAAGAASPVPGGTVAGGTLGSLAGGSAAIWYNIKDHPAPIEEKLTYLAKQGIFDVAAQAGMLGLGKGIRAIAGRMAKNKAEVAAAEEWFRKNGLNMRPDVGVGKKAGINVYRDAAEAMGEKLDDVVTTLRARLTSARTPEQVGREFENGMILLKNTRDEQADLAFAPFRSGGSYSGGKIDMIPVADQANAILKEIGQGWKQAFGDNKPQTIKILEEAAGMVGKGDTIEGLIAKRRQLQSALDEEKLLGTVDNRRRKMLFDAIDNTLEQGIKDTHGDAAAAAYRKANIGYRRLSETLESELFSAILKKDPSLAARQLGKVATPSNIREFMRHTDTLINNKSIAPEARDEMLNIARADWLTNNFRSLKDMGSLTPSHKDYDRTSREVFDTLFANTPIKKDLSDISRNAKVLEEMLQKLPSRGEHIPAGAYATAGAIGSMVAQSPGAVGAMSGLMSLSHIPQMFAHAVVSGDKGLVNAIKYVTTWAARNAPSTTGQGGLRGGVIGAVPPAVAEAIAYINEKRKEYQ